MYQSDLDSLRDYILTHNTYFSTGYSDVYLDEKKGYVYNDKIVFPAEKLGAYFYLRLPNKVQFDYNNIYNVNDCIKGFAFKGNVVLVACVSGANASTLMENLVITLQNYTDVGIKLTTAIYNKWDVIMQELKGMSEENLTAALARVKSGYTIVSITFEMSVQAMPKKINCITNPCQPC